MSDLSIRRISIAEHADLAAQHTARTGEVVANPHPEGSDEHRYWTAAYERGRQLHGSPESEGSA